MSEETDAPQGGAEDETTSEAVESNSEATTEQDTGTEQTGQADDTGEAATDEEGDKPKRVPWFQKRIDEVTAKKYEAERDAAYWRGIAEGRIPTQQAAPQRQQEGPPQLEQFESYEDYEEAKIAYIVEQRLSQVQEQQKRQTVLQTYEERVAKFKAAHPDYDSLVHGDQSLKITPDMAEVIRESDVGPEVAYHLATNRTEADRIAALPPRRQAAELGKLEAKLTTQPAPTPKPIPPTPPQTVGAVSSGLTKPLEEMSMAEYIAARSKEQP